MSQYSEYYNYVFSQVEPYFHGCHLVDRTAVLAHLPNMHRLATIALRDPLQVAIRDRLKHVFPHDGGVTLELLRKTPCGEEFVAYVDADCLTRDNRPAFVEWLNQFATREERGERLSYRVVLPESEDPVVVRALCAALESDSNTYPDCELAHQWGL
jgi:hypothetical protein